MVLLYKIDFSMDYDILALERYQILVILLHVNIPNSHNNYTRSYLRILYLVIFREF